MSSFSTSALVVTGLALTAMTFSAVTMEGQVSQNQGQEPLVGRIIDTRPWPHRYSEGDTDYVVYAPEPDLWTGNRLQGRAVMAVTTGGTADKSHGGAPRQDLGVIWFTARTETDKQAREVTLADITIDRVNFPTAKEKEPEYAALVRKNAVAKGYAVNLDQLESALALGGRGEPVRAVRVNDDPPEIVFSQNPALLVLIDGEPRWRPTGIAGIDRAVNSPVPVLRQQDRYWFKIGERWASSGTLEGPWSAEANIPEALARVLRQTAFVESAFAHDADTATPSTSSRGKFPEVYVRSHPTELIVIDGEPQFETIPQTRLRYITNTPADVFVDGADDDSWYVLVSGRWFTAPASTGPWRHVPAKALPPDFAKIPGDSVKSAVLASVAGTPESREALVANSVPQTATIDRTKATFHAQYDGAARFQPISPTSLSYAWNSAVPIIRFGADRFFALDKGVWFTAAKENGPWSVAVSVPQEIYAIPAFSPLHYVTYVRVYGAKGNDVYVGYTPGYYGAVVSYDDNVVVYGTGYPCQPWVGSRWYGCPSTYGYGAALGYGPAVGWTLALGWAWADPAVNPSWGPWGADLPDYRPNASGGIFGENVYGLWGNDAVADTVAAWAHPYTGNYARFGLGGYYNIPMRTRRPAGEIAMKGDLYAGSDGNVYAYRERTGWESKTGMDVGGQGAKTADPDPSLDQDRLARDRAFQREQLGGYGFEPIGSRRALFDRSAFGVTFRGQMSGIRPGL